MLDAYAGTIDDDGETLADARKEIDSYLAGSAGKPLLSASGLLFVSNTLASACLASYWDQEGSPLIAYLMTGASWKNRGFARLLLREVLHSLIDRGYTQVRAFITDGNLPSEKIFRREGFARVAGPDAPVK
jgi:RimJ/RimL family protein N-acetyltransferase